MEENSQKKARLKGLGLGSRGKVSGGTPRSIVNMASSWALEESSVVPLDDLDNISILSDKDTEDLEEGITHLHAFFISNAFFQLSLSELQISFSCCLGVA